MELMCTLAVLILMTGFAMPSLSGLKGNTDQRAAADTVQARIADGRYRAMDRGVAYRLAIHQDGTKLRLAPDGPDFAEMPADTAPSSATTCSEDTLTNATAAVAADEDGEFPPSAADESGWTTIATFRPDGTCREDHVLVEVNEANFPPLRVQVRGIVGSSRVLPPDVGGGAKP